MQTVDNFNFAGKHVVIRVDFNVPLDKNHVVTDDSRIKAAIPTLKKILNEGGSVVLLSHLGRPKDGPEEKFSLKHILKTLSGDLNKEVQFSNDCIGQDAFKKSSALKPGEVLLLENLRFYKEEEKGDRSFSEKLSKHGDFYINDAFGTAHRSHASTTIIADFFDKQHKCFGYVMAGEIESINKVMNHSSKPFTAIIGGAKVSDKILIIEKLMDKANNIIIGGGMAFTFIKALGGNIGKSLCEDDRLHVAKELLEKASLKGVNIYLPSDVIIAEAFSNDVQTKTTNINDIPNDWMGLDIGPETAKKYVEIIKASKTILWNGPMGVFEMSNFEKGTKFVAEGIVVATQSGAFSLIGGGDSVAAINKYHFADKVSYVSTGGGALLEYIELGTLPGIQAIV